LEDGAGRHLYSFSQPWYERRQTFPKQRRCSFFLQELKPIREIVNMVRSPGNPCGHYLEIRT
jgi:hypothetical protein